MDLVVGTIIDGKVSGIMKFGAFIALPGGKSGLVHISEIAHSYVNEVKDFLTEGQEVKVKIIGIDDAGRINLSIKKATERPTVSVASRTENKPSALSGSTTPQKNQSSAQQLEKSSFEDKLKQFMQDSNSRISGLKQYSDRRGSGARRHRGK